MLVTAWHGLMLAPALATLPARMGFRNPKGVPWESGVDACQNGCQPEDPNFPNSPNNNIVRNGELTQLFQRATTCGDLAVRGFTCEEVAVIGPGCDCYACCRSSAPPPPPMLCSDTCPYAHSGQCQDGGYTPPAPYYGCRPNGHDESAIGCHPFCFLDSTSTKTPVWQVNDERCSWCACRACPDCSAPGRPVREATGKIRRDPLTLRGWAISAVCDYGTDCADCGPRYMQPPKPPRPPMPPPPPRPDAIVVATSSSSELSEPVASAVHTAELVTLSTTGAAAPSDPFGTLLNVLTVLLLGATVVLLAQLSRRLQRLLLEPRQPMLPPMACSTSHPSHLESGGRL